MLHIQPATKTQSRLRLALFGPSGSGKTMSALRIGTGLLEPGQRLGVIDTERGSAAKYSDRWPFDVVNLPTANPKDYTAAIDLFTQAGHDVLIIDSLSHAWEWILDLVDKLGTTKFRSNKWAAWSEATPLHQHLVDAILAYPGHVIVTMRSKTEWTVEEDGGKRTPVRVGLAPRQRDGLEYEFDLVMELNAENIGRVLKDRTGGALQDALIERPDEETGRRLAEWLSAGAPPDAPAHATRTTATLGGLTSEKAATLERILRDAGHDPLSFAARVTGRTIAALADLNTSEARRVYDAGTAAPPAPAPAAAPSPVEVPDGPTEARARLAAAGITKARDQKAAIDAIGLEAILTSDPEDLPVLLDAARHTADAGGAA